MPRHRRVKTAFKGLHIFFYLQGFTTSAIGVLEYAHSPPLHIKKVCTYYYYKTVFHAWRLLSKPVFYFKKKSQKKKNYNFCLIFIFCMTNCHIFELTK